MAALTVLLDTNILHREGLYSTRIQMLQRLLNHSQIKLAIPEIVIEEYKSKLISTANDDLNKITRGFKDLKRKCVAIKSCRSFEQSLSSILKSEINHISDVIDKWISDNNIEVYKIANTCIDGLFRSYFSGSGAFREKKARVDIPDAVVFDAVVNIAKETDLCVILNDDNLMNAITKLGNVDCYRSLEDFLSRDGIRKIIDNIDRKDRKINIVKEYLNSADFGVVVEDHFSTCGIDGLECAYYDDSIEFPFEFCQIDIINAEVIAENTSEKKEIYIYNPNYLGNDKYSVSISIPSKASIMLYCSVEGYDELPSKARKALSSTVNKDDGNVHVTGFVDVQFKGVLILDNIADYYDISELKTHLSYIGADKCVISCTLEIESVEIDDLQFS